MKLVKLLDKPLSAVAGIVGIPESEKITTKESLLVSDDRWTLLNQNHVRTHLVKNFSETAVANLGSFDKTKTYVIKDFVKPSEMAAFDPSQHKVGEYFFVFEEGPKHPGKPPVMDKPAPGYKFTLEELTKAKVKFDREMQAYMTELEEYQEAVKTFITTGEASYKEYGWLIQVVSEEQYFVIADFSFETTKDAAQFGVMGKLPKEVATKVTEALGGFEADDSIKGLTIAEIIEQALGLEFEEEIVGTYQPEE